jgi:glucose/arabinose dehydrogenase
MQGLRAGRRLFFAAAWLALGMLSGGGTGWLAAAHAQPLAVKTQEQAVRVVRVVEGLEHPWGLAFLPDGRMLVTERPGRLRIVDAQGALSEPVQGVPPVNARAQGGLTHDGTAAMRRLRRARRLRRVTPAMSGASRSAHLAGPSC